MKTIIVLLLLAVSSTTLYAQEIKSTPIQRYGGCIDIQYVGNSDAFGYYIAGDYKYTFEKKGVSGNHIASLAGGIGVAIDDQYHILLGGGYEGNITNQRSQWFANAKVNLPILQLSGKLLFSQYQKYPNNVEISAMIYPSKGIFGIGGFYSTDYDCTVFGGKISLRFSNSDHSGGGGRTKPCSFCPAIFGR